MVQKTTKILDAEVVDYADDLSIPVQTSDAMGAQRILAQNLRPTVNDNVVLTRTRIVDPVNVEVTTSGQFITIADSDAWTEYDEIELRMDLSYANEAPSTEDPPVGDNRLVHLARISTDALANLDAADADTPDLSNTQYLGITGGPFPHASVINRLRSTATSFVLARDADNNLMLTWNETGVHIYPLSVFGISYGVNNSMPLLRGYTSWLMKGTEVANYLTGPFPTMREMFPDDIYDRATFNSTILPQITYSAAQLAARTAGSSGTAEQQVIAQNMDDIEDELFERVGYASRITGQVQKVVWGPMYHSSNGSAPIAGITMHGSGVPRGNVDAHPGDLLYPAITILDFSAYDLTTPGFVDQSNWDSDIPANYTGTTNLLANTVFTLAAGTWSIQAHLRSAGEAFVPIMSLRMVEANVDDHIVNTHYPTTYVAAGVWGGDTERDYQHGQFDTLPFVLTEAKQFYITFYLRAVGPNQHSFRHFTQGDTNVTAIMHINRWK